MVIHVMTRKVAMKPEDWEKRAQFLRDRLTPVLKKQPGFQGWTLLRSSDGASMTEVTQWASADDCRRYVRAGGAATAATIMDAIVPTAPYPDGAWQRSTYDVVAS